MKRVNVTDVTGNYLGWFDADKAEEFNEDTWWNGNNHISHATGSQWSHESLYRAASGRYFLSYWSDVQGSIDSVNPVDKAGAAEWLAKNNYKTEDIPAELVSELQSMEL